MLLNIINILLIVFACAFCFCVVINKIFTKKLRQDGEKYSDFIATMSFFLAFYVIFAILDCFLISDIKNKLIMLLFALSPFIIGKVATYEQEKMYSILQLTVILYSALFVLRFIAV